MAKCYFCGKELNSVEKRKCKGYCLDCFAQLTRPCEISEQDFNLNVKSLSDKPQITREPESKKGFGANLWNSESEKPKKKRSLQEKFEDVMKIESDSEASRTE